MRTSYKIAIYRLNKKPKVFDICNYKEWVKLGKFMLKGGRKKQHIFYCMSTCSGIYSHEETIYLIAKILNL